MGNGVATNGNGSLVRWLLGIAAAVIVAAILGGARTLGDHGERLARVEENRDALKQEIRRGFREMGGRFDDLNERLRFIERREAGHPRP